jgi:hypothetical protein
LWWGGEGGIFEGEKRVREEIKLVSDTGIKGGGNKNKMGTIVSEGRGEIKPSCAMLGPRRALQWRVV